MRFLFYLLLLSANSFATVYIRYNEAAYFPLAEKKIVIMSDSSLEGQFWEVRNSNNASVLKMQLGESISGKGDFLPLAYNYIADISSLKDHGKYTFTLAGQTKTISIENGAYQKYIEQILRYYRVQRSGSSEAIDHKVSHLRDSASAVYIRMSKDNGNWTKKEPASLIDVSGGWYDAGDYLKFTLTTAYSAYLLLRSYETNPALFTKIYSKSDLPDVLDEAKWGLDYLMKVMPDSNTFIIQVGSHIDHRIGDRLPEDDLLDGARGAYSCLSPTQMGYTAAALALGADVFGKLNQSEIAEKYKAMAAQIYARAKQSSEEPAWYQFENEKFYNDHSKHDNMALGAVELYRLTKEKKYLNDIKTYATQVNAGGWFSWGSFHAMVNLRMAESQQNTLPLVLSDLKNFHYESQYKNNLWAIPHKFTWGSLYSFFGVASTSILYTKQSKDSAYYAHAYHVADYLFGKNNWGVSFIASPDLSNSVKNIYSQVYRLQPKLFPTGAVAEGPGDIASHNDVKQYYKYSSDNHPMNKFNTPTIVFYDENTNFQCMETTLGGLGDAVFFLTLYSTYIH